MDGYTGADLEKELLIKELLHPFEPRAFGLKWAVKNKKVTSESITDSYSYLISVGVSKKEDRGGIYPFGF